MASKDNSSGWLAFSELGESIANSIIGWAERYVDKQEEQKK